MEYRPPITDYSRLVPQDLEDLYCNESNLPEGLMVTCVEGEEESDGNDSDDEYETTEKMVNDYIEIIRKFLSSKKKFTICQTHCLNTNDY